MITGKPRLLLGAATFLVAMMLFVACGDDDNAAPALDQPDETGRALVDQFFTLLKDKDTAGLQDFLSGAFISQRADGSFQTKDGDYLTKLPDVRDYTIEAVSARQDGNALTVRWDVVVNEVIGGKTYSSQPAPRLSTFVWDSDAGRWRMTGHANFNAPPTATPASAR